MLVRKERERKMSFRRGRWKDALVLSPSEREDEMMKKRKAKRNKTTKKKNLKHLSFLLFVGFQMERTRKEGVKANKNEKSVKVL